MGLVYDSLRQFLKDREILVRFVSEEREKESNSSSIITTILERFVEFSVPIATTELLVDIAMPTNSDGSQIISISILGISSQKE
jgi:hypothetical protein